jgi:hypothetical protein
LPPGGRLSVHPSLRTFSHGVRFRSTSHCPQILRPARNVAIWWYERPELLRPTAARPNAYPVSIAFHGDITPGARRNLEPHLGILMNEDGHRSHHERGSSVFPSRASPARRQRVAKRQIGSSAHHPLMSHSGLELAGKLRSGTHATASPCDEEKKRRWQSSSHDFRKQRDSYRMTVTSIRERYFGVCQTRWACALKSDAFASKMFGTHVWGLRSYSGNQVLCTCTMMRCPFRN